MAKAFPLFGPYNIVADTNALWSQDERKLVSTGFENALVELRKVGSVHIYIPEVVIGELVYQKFEAATMAIQKATSELRRLSQITGRSSPTICSEDVAKKLIHKKYADWCKANEARRFRPKIRQVNWNKIVEDAIWRVAPFQRSEDRKHEKGFRDRVVLESVIQLSAKNTNETVLLTDDKFLAKAAVALQAKHLSVVPRLEDFTSRVRLRKESETKEWVNALFEAASVAFYAANNPNSLYVREKVYDQLVAHIQDPLPEVDPILSILQPKHWVSQTEEHAKIVTTRFDGNVGERYQWKTIATLAAAVSGKGILDTFIENIRISTFDVHWSSRHSHTNEILDSRVERVSLAGRHFLDDTTETRAEWSVPPKPVPLGLSLSELYKNLPTTT